MTTIASTAGRRPALTSAVLYALLAIIMVGQALTPGRALSYADALWFAPPWAAERPAALERPANPDVGDAWLQMYPFLRAARREMPAVPLWNPALQSGRPFLANGQSQVFSPFTVPVYAAGVDRGMAIVAVLKLFLAAFGTFLLARALGQRSPGAFLAGLAYGFSMWIVTWLVFPHSAVWALVPGLLWLGDLVIRRPRPAETAALAAGVGAVLLCGHPESSFHACMALAIFAVARLVQLRRSVALRVGPRLLALALAALGGLALAALVVLPFAELLLGSADIHQRAGSAADTFLQRRYLLGGALYDYWGRPTGTELEPFLFNRAIYVGAIPLLLGLWALVRRPLGARLTTALLGLACGLVAFGIPPLFQVVAHLPVFSSGHNTRLVVFSLLALALLAGWGLDDLVARRPAPGTRRRMALAAGAVLVALPVCFALLSGHAPLGSLGHALRVAWGFATPPPLTDAGAGDVIRLNAVLLFAPFAAAGVALLALRSHGRIAARTFVVLVCLLTAADLARAGMGQNPAIPRAYASQPDTGAIRFLQREGGRFVRLPGIPDNVVSMDHGLREAGGYDLPIVRRYDTLWRTWLSPEYPSQSGPFLQAIPLALPRVTPERLRVLRVLGVRWIMQAPGDPALTLPGVRLAHAGRDARVWEVLDAAPRAAVVGEQRVAGSGAAALRGVGDPSFDARTTAITERPVAGIALAGTRPSAPAGTATVRDAGPQHVVIRATAQRPALVVLADESVRGWSATVDGRDVPAERVDYALRAVRITAGAHVVEWRYAPASWTAGWIISLLALASLVSVAAWDLTRRRRGRRARQAPPGARSQAARRG